MPSGSRVLPVCCSVPSRWPVGTEYPDWETCPGPRVGCLIGVLLGQVSWRSPIGKLRATEGDVGTREVQVTAGPTSPAGEYTRAKHSLKQTHHKDAPVSPDGQLLSLQILPGMGELRPPGREGTSRLGCHPVRYQ